jgi:hypothetical protein
MVPRRRQPNIPVRSRVSTLARAVLAFVAIVQLAVLGVTPWTEVRAESALGSHVEKPGELHQLHDEDRCASCVMRHLMGDVRRAATDAPVVIGTYEPPLRAAVVWSPSERLAPDAARAPPRAA